MGSTNYENTNHLSEDVTGISNYEIIELLRVDQLAEVCENCGLKRSGRNKREIINRLLEYSKNDLKVIFINCNLQSIIDLCEKLEISCEGSRLDMQLRLIGNFYPDVYKKDRISSIERPHHIQEQIEQYFKENSEYNIVSYSNSGLKQINLNGKIFALENYIFHLKGKYDINLLLDARLISKNIIKSFESQKDTQDYFREADYQIPVLMFLSSKLEKERSPKMLIEFANEFFEQECILDCLTYPDLKIHLTGGTRCKSYFQNAVDKLHDLGLVRKSITDNSSEQKYLPNYFGIIISSYLKKNSEAIKRKHPFYFYHSNDVDYILSPIKFGLGFAYNPILKLVIDEMNEPRIFTEFFKGEFGYLNENQLNLAREIMFEYFEMFSESIKFEYDGNRIAKVSMVKEFKDITKSFFKKLNNNDSYKNLFKKILHHYGIITDMQHNLFESN